MLHNEARKLVLEAWDKTHNAREIAKYFSVNESTVYRLIEERARTGSYETRTQLRGRKTILTEKQHHDILELVQEQPDITMKEFGQRSIRCREICEKHQNGSRVSELSEEYALSEKSIQRILRCTATDGKNTD